MPKRNVIFVRLLTTISFLLLFSCKQDNLTNNKNFEVTILIKTKKSDIIKLYFLFPGDTVYTENKMLKESVDGKDEFQEIIFSIHKTPSTLRIDLGEFGYLDTLEVDTIKLKSGKNEINISNKEIHRFFKPNIYVKGVGSKFFRKRVDGRYDPFLISSALLRKKIQLEF